MSMKPVEIYDNLSQSVIGQEETLRYVSVAIFKHLQGEKYGNLLLIGNSGTGKTTIMRAIEALYNAHQEFEEYRVVLIMNANTLATEEGAVDTSRLFTRLEERTRQVLGDGATAEQIGRAMERATVCLDEIDKVSGMIGGKPYVTGINIQQAVLTLIEGERVPHRITAPNKDGVIESASAWIDTGKMLFLCAGAFETLYDQVFHRVTSPKSGIKLPTTTTYVNGKITIREYFTLRHHFRQEDLFEYGMQPQFLSRFDNAVILEDLTAGTLARIFREPAEGVLRTSQNFFQKYNIELDVTDDAVQKIAEEASKSSRIGARALKSVYGKIIKPFEFDPFSREEVKPLNGDGGPHRLVIDDKLVSEALKPAV
ncbi:MAG TPA: AAA family ATPase [Thermoanaerobaculia bacterium]|jgi:ATP-dependent Clp protease ATP-binding subunit ClpX|nr:AAA family ATPase [Thermoanaerobaculia bacterium]